LRKFFVYIRKIQQNSLLCYLPPFVYKRAVTPRKFLPVLGVFAIRSLLRLYYSIDFWYNFIQIT